MGFTMPHIFILVGAAIVGLALLLQIIGFATPIWATRMVQGDTLELGLWGACRKGYCQSYAAVADSLEAVRAFGILAILALVGSLACAVLTCFMAGKKIIPLVAFICAVVAAFCILIEFAVFAGEAGSNVTYGYSFGLTIVAWLLSIAGAVLLFLGYMKSGGE
ncbi:hypothetical protein ACOMHN_054935 [Nucella lapillus]